MNGWFVGKLTRTTHIHTSHLAGWRRCKCTWTTSQFIHTSHEIANRNRTLKTIFDNNKFAAGTRRTNIAKLPCNAYSHVIASINIPFAFSHLIYSGGDEIDDDDAATAADNTWLVYPFSTLYAISFLFFFRLTRTKQKKCPGFWEKHFESFSKIEYALCSRQFPCPMPGKMRFLLNFIFD